MAAFSFSTVLPQGIKLIDTPSGQPFRLNCLKLMLTYATYLEKETFRQFILCKPTCQHARIWITYEGVGEEASQFLTHVLIDFGCRRFETRNEGFFDFGRERPLIRIIDGRNKGSWHFAVLLFLNADPGKVDLIRELGPDKPNWSQLGEATAKLLLQAIKEGSTSGKQVDGTVVKEVMLMKDTK